MVWAHLGHAAAHAGLTWFAGTAVGVALAPVVLPVAAVGGAIAVIAAIVDDD